MSKNAVTDWSTTAASNTDIGGISLAEGVMLPSAVNNALREMMAQIATGVMVKTAATTTVAAKFTLAEATNNGTNTLTITPTASLTADRTATFPDASGTVYLVDQAFVAPAGTTSITPITLQSGTLNTTAAAGGLEYDGKAIYATTVASARQAVAAQQFVVATTTVSLSNSSTSAQNVFAAANDTLTLAASTTYFYEAVYLISTGTTSHTTAVSFAGTATFTSSSFTSIASATAGAGTVNTNVYGNSGSDVTTSRVINAATTQPYLMITLRGVMRVNGGGTIIPQITFSAGPGSTCQVETNSYFRCWPVGSDTVAALGNWA